MNRLAQLAERSTPMKRDPRSGAGLEEQVTDPTRRGFLRRAGAGAVAVGVVAVAGAPLASASPSEPTRATPSTDTTPLMAHVSNPSKGEVSIFIGEHETVITDHDLVARLTRAGR